MEKKEKEKRKKEMGKKEMEMEKKEMEMEIEKRWETNNLFQGSLV